MYLNVVDLFQTLNKINVRQGSLLQTLDQKVDQLASDIRQNDYKMIRAEDVRDAQGKNTQDNYAQMIQGEEIAQANGMQCQSTTSLDSAPEQALIDLVFNTSPVEDVTPWRT